MKESHHGEIRELTRDEIEHFLKQNMLGRLGLCLGNVPYVVPISYVCHNHKIYLHMATKGQKVEFIQQNNQACFEVDAWGETGWLSVICYGRVSLHNDFETKKIWFEALNEVYHGGQEIPDERIKNMNAYIGVMEIEQMTGRAGRMVKPTATV
ncbi:MAG: pyridoxamine 5'-phosphate oxidase family protein [Dehalococcoidales bacterium]|nr:pyridoxamine 5'-phosphate oxidase family protein [Dehalococcoidales bacterium]